MKFTGMRKNNRGFTLLLAVLLATIVLAIGISILNITLKEFLLSNVARESAAALGAADAGLECGLYWDRSSQGNKFDINAPLMSVSCMGQNISVGGETTSGDPQTFEVQWNGVLPTAIEGTPPPVCAIVTVYKYYDLTNDSCMVSTTPCPNQFLCPAGAECTSVLSRGYNNACNELPKRNTVERALRALY